MKLLLTALFLGIASNALAQTSTDVACLKSEFGGETSYLISTEGGLGASSKVCDARSQFRVDYPEGFAGGLIQLSTLKNEAISTDNNLGLRAGNFTSGLKLRIEEGGVTENGPFEILVPTDIGLLNLYVSDDENALLSYRPLDVQIDMAHARFELEIVASSARSRVPLPIRMQNPVVAISRERGNATCTGTMISSDWIMTSARCFGASETYAMEIFAQNIDNTIHCLTEPRPPQEPGVYPCSARYSYEFQVFRHPGFDGSDPWQLCGGNNSDCLQNQNPSICYEGCIGIIKFDDEDALSLIHIDGGFEPYSGIRTERYAPLSRYNVPTDGLARVITYDENALRVDAYDIEDVDDRDIEVDDGRSICARQFGSPLVFEVDSEFAVAGVLSEWSRSARCADRNDRLDFTRVWEPKARWIQDTLGYQCTRLPGLTDCSTPRPADAGTGGSDDAAIMCNQNQFCCPQISSSNPRQCLSFSQCQPVGTECQ